MTLEKPFLSPIITNLVPVAEVNFPADDASAGYERGNAVSKPWHEAVVKSALQLATQTSERMPRLISMKYEDPQAGEKIRTLLAKMAERAFRRPIDDSLRKIYVERNFENNTPLEAATRQVCSASSAAHGFCIPDFPNPKTTLPPPPAWP